MKEVDRQSTVSLLEPEAARGGPTDNQAMSAVGCELADRTQFNNWAPAPADPRAPRLSADR